jgi:large subunit ribosomal protein L29
MKADKIRGMDAAELQRQSADAQEQLFRLRFQMGMGQFEGLKKYRALKKDRARMLTTLSEKRIAGETIPELQVAPKKAAPAASAKKTKAAKPPADKKK